MNLKCCWTLSGDFTVVDGDDENAPLAKLTLHEPLKSWAIDRPEYVAKEILKAMAETPHPYGDLEPPENG
jgi:hypothetical protein